MGTIPHQTHPSAFNRAKAQAGRLETHAQPLLGFWKKVQNDWVLNFSGFLAYNFLLSIFPIMLVLLAIAGLVVGSISPESYKALENSLASALPSDIGHTVVEGALTNLRKSAGIILIIGVLTAIVTGSRLFIAIESCSGIIFRLKNRLPLQQNIMAIGMLLLYVVLVPIIFLASIIAQAFVGVLGFQTLGGVGNVITQVIGIVVAFAAAGVLFGAIYVVVPNRPVRFKEVWRGTLVSAGLLLLYELLFPLYTHYFLKPGNYGSVAAFAIVILVFFYYLSFILLLGMEVNSWAAGQRAAAGDLPTVMHEVQAHRTVEGAAGPTAGTPREDIKDHRGAAEQPTNTIDTNEKPPEHGKSNRARGTSFTPRVRRIITR